MIRVIDFCAALLGLILLSPVLVILYVLGLFDTGSPLFFQQRVGKQQKIFTLIKFRTMPVDTQSVATHLVGAHSVTKFGHFLRRTKLDELPQLVNVIKGDMSLVGPRPCLSNQEDVIRERVKRSVFDVRPGITGFSQINDIDMSRPVELAKIDEKLIMQLNLKVYFSCIIKTVLGAGRGDRI